MPFCYKCGRVLPGNAKFCDACGVSVAELIPPPPETPVSMAFMSEESVYAEPIVVARASPTTVKDLKRGYESKRESIQRRLGELRAGWSKTDEGIFAELCYCILLAGRSAEATLPVIVELEKNKLLFRESKQEIEKYLKEHDYDDSKERYNYVVNWRCRFSDQGSLRIKSFLESRFKTLNGWNIHGMREYLASQHDGVGWKVASQFLRNIGIGLGYGLALLDRHIQRELKKFGYITEVYIGISGTGYLEYETRMRKLAMDSGVPMDDLDLLIWSNETGKIIK